MEKEEINKLINAGKIAKQVIEHAKSIIKPGMPLLKIVNEIEDKIISLGGKPAFPVNLSINEISAHATPSYNDEEMSHGLLKVDIGVHIDGYIADTALSLDLESLEENKNMIRAAEIARDNALSSLNLKTKIREIGTEINKTCKSFSVQPIHNLSGHSINKYNLHAGITIPNYDNSQDSTIKPGVYAIEPFTTLLSASGSVRDGKPSGIFHLEKMGQVRDNFAREVLKFIAEEYKSLPFCSRWIHKKYSTRGILALRQIEQAGFLHSYPQLIEKSNSKVAQAEHTFILTTKEKIITTL